MDTKLATAAGVFRFDDTFKFTFVACFVFDRLEGEAIFSAGRVLATTLRAALLAAIAFDVVFLDEARPDDATLLDEESRLDFEARLEDETQLAAGLRAFDFAADFFAAGFFALLFEGELFVAAFLAGFFFAAAFFARLAILRRLPYSNLRRYSGRP